MIIYYRDGFGGGQGESRALLKAAIAEYTKDAAKAEALAGALKTGKLGKPYIDGFCNFSVSHSNSVWAVLFSDEDCGLDIQFARKCDIIAIARRVFAPDDASAVEELFGEDAAAAKAEFFRIWTRREALAKAPGLSAFESDLPSVRGESAVLGGVSWHIRDIKLPGMPELFAAICTRGAASEELPAFSELLRFSELTNE